MTKPFTPLVSSTTPATQPAAQPFHAFASPVTHPAGNPQVTVKRDGDRITHIVVTCACGQVTELACEY